MKMKTSQIPFKFYDYIYFLIIIIRYNYLCNTILLNTKDLIFFFFKSLTYYYILIICNNNKINQYLFDICITQIYYIYLLYFIIL